MTHIRVSKLNIISSDNGLSPGQCQAIILINAGILLTGPLGTNFSEISIWIYIFSFKKMPLKLSSGYWWPFCLSFNAIKLKTGPFTAEQGCVHLMPTAGREEWHICYFHNDWNLMIVYINPQRCGCDFKSVIFKSILGIDILSTCCKIELSWIPQNSISSTSTLVQVMAWCRQTTSHNLSQCWPIFMSPYGITRPQWVK